jgi:hypothetical protein
MPGLDPGIFFAATKKDRGVKPGDDENCLRNEGWLPPQPTATQLLVFDEAIAASTTFWIS